jgi:cysteine desulfurase/selenocysteine lyase
MHRGDGVTVIDVERVRAETPGCEERLHFNNAGASLMPSPVVDTVVAHLELEARIGGYEAKDAAAGELDRVYDSAARLINCDPSEIALLENATRAWYAVFSAIRFERGDRIVTGRAEYVSNYLAYLRVARTTGAEIVVVDDDGYGQIDVAKLGAELERGAKLITLTHVPTSGGLVNPAADVGKLAREADVPFLLDACQSVGQMPIDVEAIGCNFLSTTGRKFLRAPRGTGFLYVGESRLSELDPAMPEVGSASWTARNEYTHKPGAKRFETWEASHGLQLGLGRAIDYALELGLDPIWERVSALAAQLRERLEAIRGVETYDLGRTKCGIVTFAVEGTEAETLRARLAERQVNVHLSEPGDTRLDFEARGLPTMIRASVHYFNTEAEVTRFSDLVEELAPPTTTHRGRSPA